MSKGKLLAVCLVWLMLLGVGVAAWKLLFVPSKQAAEKQQAEARQRQQAAEQEQKLANSSSESRYHHQIDFRLDSFSGYAMLRSPEFSEELRASGIRLRLHDDQADYRQRLAALGSGEAQLAVFTIDALVKTCAAAGELPATIVAILDETTGADAVVAYQAAFPNVDALNRPDARFVLTPDSPSETLARVIIARFDLHQLPQQPFIAAQDAADVFARYRQAKPGDPQVYVLWEPYVTQALQNSELHVIADSSRFPAAIVDVIVASRDFLVKNPEVVRQFVEAYLRTVYRFRDREAKVQLVQRDAAASHAPLSPEEASRLVDGIWWKNTQENLAHLGLLAEKKLPHLEDMIADIIDVLVSTGGIERDPTAGRPHLLYYSRIGQDLQSFHPGDQQETVRAIDLPSLSEEQWQRLEPVGTARVPQLFFARGTDQLTEASRAVLDDLASRLTTTRFYVLIRGNASTRGDAAANRRLAEARARAAEQYLLAKGIGANRIRAVGGEPSGETSVTFVLGQLPY